jgi:DNA-binding PadR family transcriptional regulator
MGDKSFLTMQAALLHIFSKTTRYGKSLEDNREEHTGSAWRGAKEMIYETISGGSVFR